MSTKAASAKQQSKGRDPEPALEYSFGTKTKPELYIKICPDRMTKAQVIEGYKVVQRMMKVVVESSQLKGARL